MITRHSEYIHFGCGLCAPQSWRNFDAGPAFWLQHHFPFLKGPLVRYGYPGYPRNIEYGNIIKGLPLASSSVKAVYSSHVLEHLTLSEFRRTIRNVHSYLEINGVFRFVVPDLEYMAKSYLTDTRADAASRFMRESYLGEEDDRNMRWLLRQVFGRSRHYSMWDYKSMEEELAQAGFTNIRRAEIGDFSDSRFADVEDPGRWLNCLGVECIK